MKIYNIKKWEEINQVKIVQVEMIENVKKNLKNSVDVLVRLPNLIKIKKVKIETNTKVAMIVIKRKLNIKIEEIVVNREKVDREVEVTERKKIGKIKLIKPKNQR